MSTGVALFLRRCKGEEGFQPGNGLICGAGNGIVFQRRGSIMKLVQLIKKFGREEDGVTAIEYGLIAALIAVLIIASVKLIGTDLVVVFTKIATELGLAA
jgi:pilus assembly protein Flp/PilA